MSSGTTRCLGLTFLIGWGCAGAQDWPGFRGPGMCGCGPEKAIATIWNENENLIWKTPLPGHGSSSPIVFGKNVFVTCYSGYGLDKKNPGDPGRLERHLTCVDAATGKIAWDRSVPAVLPEVPWRGRMQEHGYASHTPAAEGDRVYVFFGKSGVLAFDLLGNQIWRQSVGTDSDKLKWGSAASVTLSDQLVFINAWDESKALFALRKTDGHPVWQKDLSQTGLSFATPILAQLKDRQELVSALPERVWGLDPNTGEQRWWIRTSMKGIVTSTPLVVDDIAYIHGGGPGNLSSLAVRLGGHGDVTKTHILWSSSHAASVPSPVYHERFLYWVNNDGWTCCQDALTGALAYREKLPVAGRFSVYASLVRVLDHLYAVTRQGGTFVLSADPQFNIIARNHIATDRSDFSGSPAISQGRLFLRSNRFLYCIGTL